MIGAAVRPPARRTLRSATALGTLAIVASGLLFVGRSADPALADPPAEAARTSSLRTDGLAASIALERLHLALEAAIAAGREGPLPRSAATAIPLPPSAAPLIALTPPGDRPASQSRRSVASSGGPRPRALRSRAWRWGRPTWARSSGSFVGRPFGLHVCHQSPPRRAHRGRAGFRSRRLERRDPQAALEAADRADRELAAVRAWKAELVTLPLGPRPRASSSSRCDTAAMRSCPAMPLPSPPRGDSSRQPPSRLTERTLRLGSRWLREDRPSPIRACVAWRTRSERWSGARMAWHRSCAA